MAEEIKVETATVSKNGIVDVASSTVTVQQPETAFVSGMCTEEDLAKAPTTPTVITASTSPSPEPPQDPELDQLQKEMDARQRKINATMQKDFMKSFSDMIPMDLAMKENKTEEDKEAIKGYVRKYLIKQFLDKYELNNCDLAAELEKIRIFEIAKKNLGDHLTRKEREIAMAGVVRSSLSKRQRDAVVAYYMLFVWGPVVQKKIEEIEAKKSKNEELTKDEQELYSMLSEAQGSDDKSVAMEDAYKKITDAGKPETPATEPPSETPEDTSFQPS